MTPQIPFVICLQVIVVCVMVLSRTRLTTVCRCGQVLADLCHQIRQRLRCVQPVPADIPDRQVVLLLRDLRVRVRGILHPATYAGHAQRSIHIQPNADKPAP